MKKTLLLSALALATCIGFARAELHVLSINGVSANGPTNHTSELRIEPFQTAEIIYMRNWCSLDYVYNGIRHDIPGVLPPSGSITLPGPGLIRLWVGPGQTVESTSMVIIRTLPEPLPPDHTVIVLPGPTNRAEVTLEASTNLVDWAATTNGVYSDLPVAQFFRIAVKPVQL